jgi:hypothetical protein
MITTVGAATTDFDAQAVTWALQGATTGIGVALMCLAVLAPIALVRRILAV